jgi:hypothetical protein
MAEKSVLGLLGRKEKEEERIRKPRELYGDGPA